MVDEGVHDRDDPRVLQVLSTEYGMLMGALAASWSASLARSSIFLAVVSAAGIALGFAAQGGVDRPVFVTLALVILPIVAFLGVATFVRLVQVQRESVVYITGMNRIRHVFGDIAPAAAPYFVLPRHDDPLSLYRSVGTGMSRRPPRYRLLYLIVQTQGIVGVVTGIIVAAIAGLATLMVAPAGLGPWFLAVIAFLATVGMLVTYWQRSLAELEAAIDPRFPTPSDEVDAPF